MIEFEKVIAALPTLSEPQLRELRLRLDHLLGPGPSDLAQAGKHDRDYHRLADAIVEATGRRKHLLGPANKMRQASQGIASLVEEVWGPGLKEAEKIKATRLLVRLASSHLSPSGNQEGRPIGLAALLGTLLNASDLIDRAFPGYRESGLLGKVLSGAHSV